MFEEIRKAVGWFRELEQLGTFDRETGFRCDLGATKEQAESLISELVADIEVLEKEWESFRTRVSDPGQEEVVRALPNDLRDFYLDQLLPNRPLLVRAYIAALVREIRTNFLRLINLLPFEDVLAKRFPEAPEKRYEVAVLTNALSGNLQDITAVVRDFGQVAEQAMIDFDTGSVIQERLIPVAGRVVEALPDDYREMDSDLPLDVLRMHVEMHQRYSSHLCSYNFSKSFHDIFSRPLDAGPEPAAEFLLNVLNDWYERASDEGRFSDGGAWLREGKSHEQKLYKLCKREAVWHILDRPLFQPEEWQSNLQQLQPIVFEDQVRLNWPRRNYVEQVYKSFVFGQWSAVFALSRALLEDVVKERLKLAGGNESYVVNGKNRTKDLGWLIEDLVEKRPELAVIQTNMHNIREQGNKALHGFQRHKESAMKESAMIDAEQRFRLSALEVIRQLKMALEALFARADSSSSI